MKTKNFSFYVLLIIPLIIMSCGNRPKRTAEANKDTTSMNASRIDTGKMGQRDTTMRGGAMGTGQGDVKDFIKEAVSGGMMEIELGRYAEKNAKNPRVKKFGAMMVRDHSKANNELKDVVAKKNMEFPAAMEDKTQMTDVMKKKGADFDKDYMDMMVKDHEKVTDKFKKEAESNDDQDIKAWASKTLPVLLMHLDSAKMIKDAVK